MDYEQFNRRADALAEAARLLRLEAHASTDTGEDQRALRFAADVCAGRAEMLSKEYQDCLVTTEKHADGV